MIYPHLPVVSVESVGTEIFVLTMHAPRLAVAIAPGHFLNIKVEETTQPLLRRPFSVYKVDGEDVSIIFNVVGTGTRILAQKRPGDTLDVLGPLGTTYTLGGDYTTALLVGGGLGVAPLPVLTDALIGSRKILTFLGGRSAGHIVEDYLHNVHIATDDGSAGAKGTVVDLLTSFVREHPITDARVFACGPTPMLRSLQRFAVSSGIPCEFSLESAMACGIGLCQGCPVKRIGTDQTYSLVCKEGPVFDASTVVLE